MKNKEEKPLAKELCKCTVCDKPIFERQPKTSHKALLDFFAKASKMHVQCLPKSEKESKE